ncbi:MAG: KAP family NTPase [Promethearchaeota archaeon]
MSDKPKKDPEEDRFGYNAIAKHLAKCILKVVPSDGLTIGVYGKWGSGKTTLLNFIEYHLEQKELATSSLKIIKFHPWWFSGQENLTQSFFNHLVHEIGHKKWKLISNLMRNLAGFIIENQIKGKSIMNWLARNPKNVESTKERITNALRKKKDRFLIIIDDIDRLVPEEIRSLFRLIKAIVDFPNITYLLAFDKKVVEKALEQFSSDELGKDYLEKIIQLPVELPLPTKTSLRKIMVEKINSIAEGTPTELINQIHWENIYFDGIRHLIRTPRDITRLFNTLAFTYPLVKGEVNFIDFISIETIRLLYPSLHRLIYNNPEEFVGVNDGNTTPKSRSFIEYHESWVENIPEEDKKPIKEMLMRLFPKLNVLDGGSMYGSEYLKIWRKERRICSPNVFRMFFRFSIPEGEISNIELKALLRLADNVETFSVKILEYSKQIQSDVTTKLHLFLDNLLDYTSKDIPHDHIPNIIKVFFTIGDKLLLDEDKYARDKYYTGFPLDNQVRIIRIILQLLERYNEEERYLLLKECISVGDSLSTIVDLLLSLGGEHGKYGGEAKHRSTLIKSTHLEDLEEIILVKLRKSVIEGSLINVPSLRLVLYWWGFQAKKEEIKSWISNIIEDDRYLIILLENSLDWHSSGIITNVVAKVNYKLNLDWLSSYIDYSSFMNRIELMESNEMYMSEKLKNSILTFLSEYKDRIESNSS